MLKTIINMFFKKPGTSSFRASHSAVVWLHSLWNDSSSAQMLWASGPPVWRPLNEVSIWRIWLWAPAFPRWQVGEERLGTLETTRPASGATVGTLEEEFEAEGKVVGAGEVVGEVQFLSLVLHWINTHAVIVCIYMQNSPLLTCSVCIMC